MTVACYLDLSRGKGTEWMTAFAKGCKGILVRNGQYAERASQHVVMGNWPVATKLIPWFRKKRLPFWYLDSGYIQLNGRRDLRVEYGRFWPELHSDCSPKRAHEMGIELKPWRENGSHVLICLHGFKFGRPWGIDIASWQAGIEGRIRAVTDRPIRVRPKPLYMAIAKPLKEDLVDAWCVVTHSSTAAVTAAIRGVPVFCEPTCGAAAVGCTDFSRIESPVYPDREPWLAALAWRQWSLEEFESGAAWRHESPGGGEN